MEAWWGRCNVGNRSQGTTMSPMPQKRRYNNIHEFWRLFFSRLCRYARILLHCVIVSLDGVTFWSGGEKGCRLFVDYSWARSTRVSVMAKGLVAWFSWKSSMRLSTFVTFATSDSSNRQGFPYMNGVRRLMESVGSASFKMKSLAIIPCNPCRGQVCRSWGSTRRKLGTWQLLTSSVWSEWTPKMTLVLQIMMCCCSSFCHTLGIMVHFLLISLLGTNLSRFE